MSERWKPEHGETYYFFDSLFTVSSYAWRDDGTDAQYQKCGNCFRTAEEALAAAEKVKALLLSLHDNGTLTANSETLKGTFIEYLKKCAEIQADIILQKARERRLSEQYHNTSKETKLPDWCKVGEWVYNKDFHEYIKVVERTHNTIKGKDIHGGVYHADFQFKNTVPARLRQWNFKEAPFAVKCRHSITAIKYQVAKLNSAGDGYTVADCCCDVTLQGMANYYEQMDGSPCGVLEHLENGEWVE